MSQDTQLRLTALFLTLFVFGLSGPLAQSFGDPAMEDLEEEFSLGLRERVTLEVAAEALETAATENLPQVRPRAFFAAVDQLLTQSPETTRVLNAALAALVAFGADEGAADVVKRIKEPDGITALLHNMAAASPSSPFEWATMAAQIQAIALVPDAVTVRLYSRWKQQTSTTEEAAVAKTAVNTHLRSVVARMAPMWAIYLWSGLLGLIGLIYMAATQAKIRSRFVGLTGPSHFVGRGLHIYLVFIGLTAFGIVFGFGLKQLIDAGILAPDSGFTVLMSTFATGIFGVWVAAKLCLATPTPFASAFGLSRNDGKPTGLAIIGWAYLAFCVSIPVSWVLMKLNQMLVGHDTVVTNPLVLLLARADSWPEALLITLAPVVLAPVFEEMLFRGFFYRMLRDRMGVYGAVLFTSFLFAAVHPSVLTILPLFALGAIFALLYEATGSILPSIMAHAMHNLASVGMLYVMLQ